MQIRFQRPINAKTRSKNAREKVPSVMKFRSSVIPHQTVPNDMQIRFQRPKNAKTHSKIAHVKEPLLMKFRPSVIPHETVPNNMQNDVEMRFRHFYQRPML